MKFYLAARYARYAEMNIVAQTITNSGHEVTSRWIKGEHQLMNGKPIGENVEAAINNANLTSAEITHARGMFASIDMEDINVADAIIAFGEPRDICQRDSQAARGGRHVELGYAIALDKEIYVIHYRENIFMSLPRMNFFHTWGEFEQKILSL